MREIVEVGAAALHRRLEEVDPVQASRVQSSDVSRLVRFLELYEITGKAPSSLLKKGRATCLRYPTETHWLCPSREALRERISQRVHQMFAVGWGTEVAGLLDRGLDPREWENKPIGYSELAQSLTEGHDGKDAAGAIIQKTRAYAKRQETFFRGMLSNSAYREGKSSLKILENFGENF